jgi:hypothetical protein
MTREPNSDHEARSGEAQPDYEAPSVEEVSTEDSPAVTAAGVICGDASDLRLKRSVRALEKTIVRPR